MLAINYTERVIIIIIYLKQNEEEEEEGEEEEEETSFMLFYKKINCLVLLSYPEGGKKEGIKVFNQSQIQVNIVNTIGNI